jgi:hypothetical protein
LEKDPWNRFPTAKALGDALRSVTFSTQRESVTTEANTRLNGPLVTLIAVTAILLGVLLGRALG